MISEGSYETEDWNWRLKFSFASQEYIQHMLNQKSVVLKSNNTSYFTLFCLNKINTALVNIRVILVSLR